MFLFLQKKHSISMAPNFELWCNLTSLCFARTCDEKGEIDQKSRAKATYEVKHDMRSQALRLGVAVPFTAPFLVALDHAIWVVDPTVVTGVGRQFIEVILLEGFSSMDCYLPRRNHHIRRLESCLCRHVLGSCCCTQCSLWSLS